MKPNCANSAVSAARLVDESHIFLRIENVRMPPMYVGGSVFVQTLPRQTDIIRGMFN
jgi:hypothetical protein